MDLHQDHKPLVLFHDQCMDGLGAAFIAWRRYGDAADYIPVRYSEGPPACEGRDVFILDFCYPPEVTARMADDAYRVVVIDHHDTAIKRFQEGWVERDNVHTLFDIGKSGAQLTAAYFNGNTHLWIVDYIEDRDLWKFELPHSQEVNALLAASCLGRPPRDAFVQLNDIRGLSLKQATALGAGALLQASAFARQVAQEARRGFFAGRCDIPIVNCAKPFTSEVLHELTPVSLFAVGWREERNKIVFSLRSLKTNGNFDCADLAQKYGGGGHRNAAGFTLSLAEAIPFIQGKAREVPV